MSSGSNEAIIDFEKQYMLVMDVYSVYKYTIADNKIVKVFDLDDLADKNDIISRMREVIL